MVDSDRIEGSGKKLAGQMKEGLGHVLGDSKMQAEGKAQQVEGKTQNFWGSVKDMFRGKRRDDYDRRA